MGTGCALEAGGCGSNGLSIEITKHLVESIIFTLSSWILTIMNFDCWLIYI